MKAFENVITDSISEGYDYSSYEKTDKIFNTSSKRHEDLKNMLDSNKDNLKLEAMKRIIGMVAKGKNASHLFPAVVKNVASKNIEVKKLVYVYLVRYAEEQQDLALLSISTFQKGLKDPNQLIRAGALRVLSSIRVSMIAPIMMLAIEEAMNDLSPYVRKTAALAIPKLYTLDPELKESLIKVIEKLMGDKTTLVIGSVIMSFEEVCPERVDLLHKNFRKLCELLVDVEEWGQCFILNTLTRYARSQFLDPNAAVGTNPNPSKNSLGESDIDSDDELFPKVGTKKISKNGINSSKKITSATNNQIDPDLKLLLKNSKPLLQSRNAAVVMAVIQMFYHCAPLSELHVIVKPLIRLLNGYREVQSIVLRNIVTLCNSEHKDLFESHLKSFFIRSHDPTHIRLLKLEILTALANATNIAIILRELQTYISSSDKDFAAATIQAIGRCASSISEITEACTAGLVNLMHSRNERVVSESVIVIKNLLQMGTKDNTNILIRMATVLEANLVINTKARASILWLLGEYCGRVPDHAPDVLRKMAKSFTTEEDLVKLQIINLAAKLYICNDNQKYPTVPLLYKYVFDLAKYDASYDVRDRARMLKQLIGPPTPKGSESSLTPEANSPSDTPPGLVLLRQNVKSILLAPKQAPPDPSDSHRISGWCGKSNLNSSGPVPFQLGTLSHYLSSRTPGYEDLPPFPSIAPDPTLRDIIVPIELGTASAPLERALEARDDDFYCEVVPQGKKDISKGEESHKSTSSGASSGTRTRSSVSGSHSTSSSGSTSDSSSGSSSESSGSESVSIVAKAVKIEEGIVKTKPLESLLLELDLGTEKGDYGGHQEESGQPGASLLHKPPNSADYSDIDDWLSKAEYSPLTTPLEETIGGSLLKPAPLISPQLASVIGRQKYQITGPAYVTSNYTDLVHSMRKDLYIGYRFTRKPHIFAENAVNVELRFKNLTSEPIKGLHFVNQVKDSKSTAFFPFHPIAQMLPNQEISVNLGIDFGDSSQVKRFDLSLTEPRTLVSLELSAPYGEQFKPVLMDSQQFQAEKAKLRGMNECTEKIAIKEGQFTTETLVTAITRLANLARVEGLKFAGYTYAGSHLALLELEPQTENSYKMTFNCDKFLIGSVFLRELSTFLLKPPRA